MPEPYAVRWTGGAWGKGKREVFWTKKEFHEGRSRASDAARKKTERVYDPIKKIGGKSSANPSGHFKGRTVTGTPKKKRK